jgi:hypothetical protein
MKRLIDTAYIFDASAQTIDLTSIANFDIKKLYSILNITRNQIIYAIAQPAYGLTSISGNTLTLVFNTTAQADTDELGIIYDDQVSEIPSDDTDSVAIAVRALPQHVSRIGFAKAISGGVDTDFFETAGIGSGMTVNQTGGNLVITTGTTARSETIIRSIASWKGGIRLRARVTLSQRIINQNFIIELVDVIGDGLAYTINSATSITVTIPNNTYTAQNVGQSVSIGGFSGTGTFLSGRYPIASVSGNNVTFTVSGFAAGTGTCSLFGMNFYRLLYQGTTATNLTYNTARNGYQNADVTATINTTASPGHLAILTGNDLLSSIHDQLVASGTGVQSTLRATAVENIPDDKNLRLQVRVLNLATAPASTTTLTIGLLSIGNYANQDVVIEDIRQMSPNPLPVEILRNVSQAVTGSVTATLGAATVRAGFLAGAGIWFDDSSTNLGISATFTGTSRDLTVTATATAFANAATYAQELVVSAESDVTGTLWLEVSRDNAAWRRVKSIATTAVTGGGFYAEIVHRPSWRYARVGYTNGAGAQARFSIGSILKAI